MSFIAINWADYRYFGSVNFTTITRIAIGAIIVARIVGTTFTKEHSSSRANQPQTKLTIKLQ